MPLGGFECGWFSLLINFVCLRGIISGLAIAQCQTTPGAIHRGPRLVSWLTGALGKAGLLPEALFPPPGNRQAPLRALPPVLLPDAPSSSDWRFGDVPTLGSGVPPSTPGAAR